MNEHNLADFRSSNDIGMLKKLFVCGNAKKID